MKRKIIAGICALFLFAVSFPAVMHIAGSVNAAGTLVEPSGEKVIDFAINAYSNVDPSDIFVITGSHQLYQCKLNAGTCTAVESDSEGKPINNVKKISLYRGKNSYKALNLLFLLDNDKVYLKEGVDGSPVLLNTSGISNIVDIASDEKNQYILTANGDVYARGDNSAGQLCDDDLQSSDTFVRINIDNVKKLSAGDKNVIALKNDGTIYAWGIAIYDGLTVNNNVSEPIPLNINGKPIQSAIDISEYIDGNTGIGLGVMIKENNELKGYMYQTNSIQLMVSKSDFNKNIDGIFYRYNYSFQNNFGYLSDGDAYTEIYTDGIFKWLFEYRGQDNNFGKIKKIDVAPTSPGWDDFYFITETGAFYRFVSTTGYNTYEIKVGDALKVKGFKSDGTVYASEEKFNDDVDIETSTSDTLTITCKVQDPLGSAETNCMDFQNNEIHVSLENDRIYRKYLFADTEANKEFIVDLYKGAPKLGNYSTSGVNKIKLTDSISLDVPTDQSSWNTYTATVTDSSNQTKDFTGGTLAEGTYTMHVTDAYGNTQDYQFEVSDKPTPTANFNPANTSLTYGDNATKVNNTIGSFTLTYPAGKPTSNIKTIQLGTGGDEAHFTVDTSGNLKVKGADLDAGTYSVTVLGTDGNDMPFTKTVSITVAKKNQDNYQITNQANYSFQLNQEITITTTGNDSGENETYTITSGNSVAQIVGNKFKLLSAGTFTLQATVGGNTNYNSKTVTKQITVSQLPTQNPPVSITSKDSIMYGETYTPSYSGGQGSGAVSWSIESDNGTGAALSNGKVTVTGIGTFTIKVTKAGTSSYQASTATKVITVNKRKTIVKPKNVTKTVGQVFKDNGATYTPQPIAGDNIGTLVITSKYPNNQAPGQYTDGIQASGLSNPNYEFVYQEGTLIINSNALPNNGAGYYTVSGTKGKNNWYISDVEISATGKNGYDEISNDGINFQSSPLFYSTDGDYPTDFYLRNSSTGLVAKAIRYQLKIDQTPPDVPTLSMKEINKSAIARFINALSFGNWMNQAAEVTMTSSDATSGLDYYEYTETRKSGTNTKQSTSGVVTYHDDVELTLQAKACDKAGNCSDLSSDEGIMIDRKAPTITGVKDKSEYKFYYLPRFVKVTDDYSGLSYSEYKLDGAMAGTIQDNVDERIDAVGDYEIYAIDNAGNDITITFKIVPLPDIQTEIDGSDQSKDIIDQVIDELDEIKDKIDATEKQDIEEWIKDALDKWNSLRKKVVETDDKSAKVEGQGDTDFDPSVILIVDDITDHADDIPPLPREPITVYDVWLQKGNVKIQPDGSIKVYLPYTEPQEALGDAMGGAKSDAKPIVYEIDEKDKVKELKVQREGNFVTFITDKLLRYAISNDKQELNKNDMCVVGPDGKPTTGDEVCGLPSEDGKQPEKKPDGSVEVPDGGKIEFPNGTEIDTPDGAIIHPDGSVTLPDGTEYDPDGNKKPSKQCKLDGIKLNIDTDGDGLPDVNIDLDKDCIADINVDMNGDNIPDLNIDSNGDGKPDINIDKNDDGKADLNILKITKWKPDKDVTINGITYDTMAGLIPDVNIDFDGDGNPDYNIDTDGDGIPDKNLIDDDSSIKNNLGGANTGDNTKWVYWWILLIITTLTMIYAQYKKRQAKRNRKIHFNK